MHSYAQTNSPLCDKPLLYRESSSLFIIRLFFKIHYWNCASKLVLDCPYITILLIKLR